MKSVELRIDSYVAGLSPADVNRLMEKENEMIMQLKLEKDRQHAKNNVEEYVYDMRGKLYDIYEKYITEEVSPNVLLILTDGCQASVRERKIALPTSMSKYDVVAE